MYSSSGLSADVFPNKTQIYTDAAVMCQMLKFNNLISWYDYGLAFYPVEVYEKQ